MRAKRTGELKRRGSWVRNSKGGPQATNNKYAQKNKFAYTLGVMDIVCAWKKAGISGNKSGHEMEAGTHIMGKLVDEGEGVWVCGVCGGGRGGEWGSETLRAEY